MFESVRRPQVWVELWYLKIFYIRGIGFAIVTGFDQLENVKGSSSSDEKWMSRKDMRKITRKRKRKDSVLESRIAIILHIGSAEISCLTAYITYKREEVEENEIDDWDKNERLQIKKIFAVPPLKFWNSITLLCPSLLRCMVLTSSMKYGALQIYRSKP